MGTLIPNDPEDSYSLHENEWAHGSCRMYRLHIISCEFDKASSQAYLTALHVYTSNCLPPHVALVTPCYINYLPAKDPSKSVQPFRRLPEANRETDGHKS